MTKQGYIRKQKSRQNRLMKKHLAPVYAALQHQVYQTVKVVQSDGVQAAYNQSRRDHYINPKIGPAVTDLYLDAGKMAQAQFQVQKSLIIPIAGFVKDVIKYFNQFLLNKIVLPISNSMKNQIETVLKQAISDGWGVDKTVSELKNSDITKNRARTIVRTESVAAMNYAQLKAADDSKFVIEKTWIATEDRRTRFTHSHAGVDGEMRELYSPFSNNLQFPGDKSGDAAEIVNCRCTMMYNVQRTLNGTPVRKPTPNPAYTTTY